MNPQYQEPDNYWSDEEDDEIDDLRNIPDEYDIAEMRENERAEIAYRCTCGAWQFNDSGDVCHVADCVCGAE